MATKKRFEVRVDPRMDADMERLAQDLQVDRAEVFRRAMTLYLRAKRDELENHSKFILEAPDGQKTELIGV